jgi:adenylosuccinate lyase
VVQEDSMKLWDKLESGDTSLWFIDVLKKDDRITKLISEDGLKKIFDKKNVLKHVDLIYKRVL